jgi:hypothetical protein
MNDRGCRPYAGTAPVTNTAKKRAVQSQAGMAGDQISQPFLFRVKIFGSERGAAFAFPQRGPSRSVAGINAPQLSHPRLRIIMIFS